MDLHNGKNTDPPDEKNAGLPFGQSKSLSYLWAKLNLQEEKDNASFYPT